VEHRFETVQLELQRLLEAIAPHEQRFIIYTGGPEKATPPLVSPQVFERLVLPYHRRLVALIHEHGYLALHCHGRVREVLPYVLACGFDMFEPIEPPPQGNIDLADLRAATAGKIALVGYVQDQEFYTSEESAIRDHVRSVSSLIGGDTGFICCPTCTPFQYPAGERYVRNYLAFLDEAERAGSGVESRGTKAGRPAPTVPHQRPRL